MLALFGTSILIFVAALASFAAAIPFTGTVTASPFSCASFTSWSLSLALASVVVLPLASVFVTVVPVDPPLELAVVVSVLDPSALVSVFVVDPSGFFTVSVFVPGVTDPEELLELDLCQRVMVPVRTS